jgi:hydrogenase/urease accessory protein HupE
VNRIAAFIVGAVLILCAGSVQAHEIGTTLVSVEFDPGRTYRIDITTDAQALAEKLATISGEPLPSAGSSPALLQAQIRNHDDLFRGRFSAAFDGAALRPDIEYAVVRSADATAPPSASIKMTGSIPAEARQFTWTYSWTFATYALAIRHGGSTQPATQWLEGGQRSSSIDLAAVMTPVSRLRTVTTYLALGFTHIVPHGFDHMLFVLGIFLLSRRMKQVLMQVSAFTIAHSITLALSIYGAVSVSPSIVEPMIAISIAYVAIENLLMSELKPWRIALVFGFGLLHGMGFAGALKEVGLPRSEFLTALITFNIGVEAGQLAVIAAAFLAVGWYWGNRDWYRRRVVMPASAMIACTAVYWTFQRVLF